MGRREESNNIFFSEFQEPSTNIDMSCFIVNVNKHYSLLLFTAFSIKMLKNTKASNS